MEPAAAMNVQMMSRMRAVQEAEANGDSEIQQLYSGSVVFITGGTGFLGKQLMEKLPRACHGIKKIYLLTRTKKGKTIEERLAKTFNNPVRIFNTISIHSLGITPIFQYLGLTGSDFYTFIDLHFPSYSQGQLVERDKKKLIKQNILLTETWPNTYTFSKAIAEEVVRVMGEGLPICVVRPASIIPAHREPEPGWLDMSNVLGPTGIFLGSCLGVIRVVLCDDDCLADIVPVDYVNNLIIASSWETARKFQRGEQDITIYTCSRIRSRLSCGEFIGITRNECRNYVSPKSVWYPDSTITKHQLIYLLLTTIFHFIPALFVDAVLMALGKKFRLSVMYQKVHKLNTVQKYFLLKTWDFQDDNTLALNNKLLEADKLIFHCDIADIEHVPFMIGWALGIRKYIIKDGLKGTEKALKIQRYMRVLHYVVSPLYLVFLMKVLFWMCNAAIICVTSVIKFM